MGFTPPLRDKKQTPAEVSSEHSGLMPVWLQQLALPGPSQ
jgi:hypothetical protein